MKCPDCGGLGGTWEGRRPGGQWLKCLTCAATWQKRLAFTADTFGNPMCCHAASRLANARLTERDTKQFAEVRDALADLAAWRDGP